MELTTKPLADTELVLSPIGLGCNNLGRPNTATADLAGTKAVIDEAVDAGINFFDVADIYGTPAGRSEELLGEALKGRRDRVVLATKFGMDMGDGAEARGSAAYIKRAVTASLQRLQVDHIDLLQYHTPDGVTPITETLTALNELVDSGKVRYFGHSNFAGWQIGAAEYAAQLLGTNRFVSAQNHYNLLDRRAELEVIPAAQAFNLGVFPYFPLANGLLTGKYRQSSLPASGRLVQSKPQLLEQAPWAQLELFFTLAADSKLTPVALALSWLATQPQVASVIAGATLPEQIRANVTGVRKLTPQELAEIDNIFPAPAPIALY